MRYFYVIVCLFFLINTAQARPIDYARDGFPPLRPQHRVIHHSANNRLALLNYRKVTEAEKTILGQTFENQDMNVRLNRLEESVFNRTYPTLSFEQRVNNIIVNYNNTAGNTSYKNLDKYEKKVFKRTFENELPENRISRLEEQVLGTIQCGDLTSRYETLAKAVPAYNKNTFTTVTPLNSYPYAAPVVRSSGWRGLAGSLGNFFNNRFVGMPTGMSPQIYSPYINNYGPDYQRGFYGNTGWNYNNTYRGSGTGVHILP